MVLSYGGIVMPRDNELFIGGEWVKPAGSATIEVVSPHTEQVIGVVPEAVEADVDKAVDAARRLFDSGAYEAMGAPERGAALGRLSMSLLGLMDDAAKLIASEMGSPYSWAMMGQVLSTTMVADYYVGLAQTYEFERISQGVMGPVARRREPIGVVGAIVPWNVPMFTAMLKLAPAVIAGCPVVLKPAPETPLSTNMLAELWAEAGFPEGSLSVLPAGREVGEYLVTHPGIDKVAFTGSTAAGRRIAALCGERLRRFTLELGGKSAAIVLDDANLATAIPEIVGAGLMNNGQACVAQTRILAPRSSYGEVVDALEAQFRAQVVGDPLDPATTIGPLVARRQQERVESYIAKGIGEGARVVAGGAQSSQPTGWYVEPTLFADVDNKMTIAQEEIFGPVLSVIPYDTVDEAVAIANDSDYGLSGSVFSADPHRGLDVARRVRTGTTNVNTFMLEFSAPFGGYKDSGMGRELGEQGLEAYLESKSICLPADFPLPE